MAGIASKNLFDLLDDDGADPNQAPKPVKNDKAGVKGAKPTPASKPAPTLREERPTRGGDRGGDRGRGPRRGGERGSYRGDRGDRPRYSGGTEDVGDHLRGRGRGAPRRGRAREDRDGREDRQNRSGVGEHHKQADQAWGAPTGEAEWVDEQAGEALAKADEATADAEPKPEGDAWAEAEGEPAEPEPKVKSYEEHLAELAEKRLQISGPQETRKPNEGANKKWKETKEITREEEQDFFSGTGAKKARERSKKEKAIVELDGEAMRPKDEPTDRRGGRGGRGGRRGDFEPRGNREDRGDRGDRNERGSRGDRGGRGRGRADFRGGERGSRGRGARGGSNAPNVLDTSAFPSLGS